MPTICRLLRLPTDQATSLITRPDDLLNCVEQAKVYSDVYRYWHAIEYLLAKHRPDSAAAHWLNLGQAVSTADGEMPAARVILAQEVARLAAALKEIEPEDLAVHYEAEALDRAGVYPHCWEEWEETFDPLGQVLEHYWFLKEFASQCALAGEALLLYFVFLDDGSDD